MDNRLINISIIRHSETGLYVAFSDDLKGLYVHARTQAELNERLPVAIKDILAASGHPVAAVTPADDDGVESFGFEPTRRRFQMREAA